MAYPTICAPCRKGEHAECEISLQLKEPGRDVGYGGWMCVCAHGGPENDFQKSVRQRIWSYESGPGTLAGNEDL